MKSKETVTLRIHKGSRRELSLTDAVLIRCNEKLTLLGLQCSNTCYYWGRPWGKSSIALTLDKRSPGVGYGYKGVS